MNLRDWRIGLRLGVGIAVIVIILAGSQFISTMIAENARSAMVAEMDAASNKSSNLEAMKSALLESAIAIRNIGLMTDVVLMKQEHEKVDLNDRRFREASDRLKGLGLSASEKEMLKRIVNTKAQIGPSLKEAFEHVIAFDGLAAAKVIVEKIDPLSQVAFHQMSELVEHQRVASGKAIEDSIKEARTVAKMSSLAAMFGVCLACFVGWTVTRSITRPLNDAVQLAKRVASGDLTATLGKSSNDELGDLLRTLQEMVVSLSSIVSSVRDGTEKIAIASEEIATASEDLSSRTETQASSLEETSASMEELTTTVKQNSESSTQANQLATSTSDQASNGGAVVQEAVDMMRAIKVKSSKIVDIIGVINGIAFQTNILALNAAVEAARAGELGLGFAVVASEVRTLAQRSASAAKEIESLIADSVHAVDRGSVLVDRAGETMQGIVHSVNKVAEIIAEISAASLQQSAGIAEVNQAISQMDKMTQRNASMVEDASSAARAMREQASKLAEAVNRFTLHPNSLANSPELRPSGSRSIPRSIVPDRLLLS